MADVSSNARRRARRLLLQALYQWTMSRPELAAIEAEFHVFNDMTKVDVDYFHSSLHGIVRGHKALDDVIKDYLDRDIKSLTPVEHQILRIGCYELMNRLEIPYRVVINEGIELAKQFGANESHKYINGVLDKLANSHRAEEISHE